MIRRGRVENRAVLAWNSAKTTPISPDPPTHQASACRRSLHGGCLQPTPTTNPAPRVPPKRRLRGTLVARSRSLSRLASNYGARSSRERPTGHTLASLPCWWSSSSTPTRSNRGISRSICLGCKKWNEPVGSISYWFTFLLLMSFIYSTVFSIPQNLSLKGF